MLIQSNQYLRKVNQMAFLLETHNNILLKKELW